MATPMNLAPPEDTAPPMDDEATGPAPVSAYDIPAPESKLSGGEWERFAPGQFAYHPSPEDLAMPDLIEHFAQIEVVGDLLIMPSGDIYEGGISHDVDDDGVVDKPTHLGSPGGEPEVPSTPPAEEPPVSENSWMNKPGNAEDKVPIPTKHY